VIPRIKTQQERYRFGTIYGDQFASEPIQHAFREAGLSFQEVTFSLQSKADLYGSLRAHIMDRRIELLDHSGSLSELRSLEVEMLAGGTARVGHPRSHGHDDYADAIAILVQKTKVPNVGMAYLGSEPTSLERELFGKPWDDRDWI